MKKSEKALQIDEEELLRGENYRFSITVPVNLYNEFETFRKEVNLNRSEAIRKAMIDYLRKNKTEHEAFKRSYITALIILNLEHKYSGAEHDHKAISQMEHILAHSHSSSDIIGAVDRNGLSVLKPDPHMHTHTHPDSHTHAHTDFDGHAHADSDGHAHADSDAHSHPDSHTTSNKSKAGTGKKPSGKKKKKNNGTDKNAGNNSNSKADQNAHAFKHDDIIDSILNATHFTYQDTDLIKINHFEHLFHDIVITKLHLHSEHDQCIVVIPVKGPGPRIKVFYELVRSLKSVRSHDIIME